MKLWLFLVSCYFRERKERHKEIYRARIGNNRKRSQIYLRKSAVDLFLFCPFLALLRVAIARLEFCQDQCGSPVLALIVNLIKGMTDQMQP